MQQNPQIQISDQKILQENKEMPTPKNIMEMIEHDTLTRTDQTDKHSQLNNCKNSSEKNVTSFPISKNSEKTQKKSSSEAGFDEKACEELGGTLAHRCSQNSIQKQGKKKQAKERKTKQKKAKKEEQVRESKASVKAVEKKEGPKAKKTPNSIKKTKEKIVAKQPVAAPTQQPMPNIMTLLNNLPIKKKDPVKINQAKCELPVIQGDTNQTKEWCIPPLKESQNNESKENRNELNGNLTQGNSYEIPPSSNLMILPSKQPLQNMAPLLQNQDKKEVSGGQDKGGPNVLKKESAVKEAEAQSQKVVAWKTKKTEYIQELKDLIDDSNQKFYPSFQTNVVLKAEFTRFEKGGKIPCDLTINKKVQSDSEQKQIVDEINRFAELTCTQDQSQFQISDQSRVSIFKIFAHLVESSKLDQQQLSLLCERYLIDQLKLICPQHSIKISAMIKKSAFKMGELISLFAEKKQLDLKNFSLKLVKEPPLENDDNVLTNEALYTLPQWEILGDVSHYIAQDRAKIISAEKPSKRRVFERARFLDKIIGIIDKLKKEKDIPKLEEEVDKYSKLLESHKIALQKEQALQDEKEKKKKLEFERSKMKDQERLMKEAEKKRKEDERLEQKRQREELLEKEKKDRFEKQLVIERERKLKAELLEKEKKEKQEKFEKEKLEKVERLEKEKKERLEKIEREKKERLERIEREKREKTERLEKEKLEKERVQKEEAEKKALEEAQLKEKQSLFKYLNKPKPAQEIKSASQQQEESKSLNSQTPIKTEDPIEQKFKDYGEYTSFAIKIQKECYMLKHQQKVPNTFENVSSENVNLDDEVEIQEFEAKNKANIAQHFRSLNKNLDKYILNPDKFKIIYGKEDKEAYTPSKPTANTITSSTVIISTSATIPSASKQSGQMKQIFRKKCIIIDDQIKSSYSIAKEFKKSKILTCRNPFKADDVILNYDMETEDEEAEQNGEDVDAEMDNMSKDSDEKEDEEEEQAGWLVDDDYLSMSEMNMSNLSGKDEKQIAEDLRRRKAILQRNRESKENQQKERERSMEPQIYIYTIDNLEFMNDYEAVNFVSDCHMGKANKIFPLDLTKTKTKKSYGEGDIDDQKKGYDANAINLKLVQLVRLVHGSIESKQKLIDDFNEANVDCSKNSIEKKIKEYFIKDKRGDEPRQRYYATEEILKQLDKQFPMGLNNPELAELAQKRIQPILDEIRLAQQEMKEKRQKEELEKEREKNELKLMRQEEQQQRELKTALEKQVEKQQRDLAKAQVVQQQEEEKKRLRDIKAKQKQEELEQKLKVKEELKAIKAKEKQLKIEEKEKQVISSKKKPSIQKDVKLGKTNIPLSSDATKSENIVQMLQKRAASTMIEQIDNLEKDLSNPSPLKKQKEETGKSTERKMSKLQESINNNQQKPQGGLMNFFAKLPPGQSATPMKLDFSLLQKEPAKVEEIPKGKPIAPMVKNQNQKISKAKSVLGKKVADQDAQNKNSKNRPKSEEKKKTEAKGKRSSSKQKDTQTTSKAQAKNLQKKKVVCNQNTDPNIKVHEIKSPEKKFKSVQKSCKNTKKPAEAKGKGKSQSKTKKNVEMTPVATHEVLKTTTEN